MFLFLQLLFSDHLPEVFLLCIQELSANGSENLEEAEGVGGNSNLHMMHFLNAADYALASLNLPITALN